ncbi:hypothetical protein GCM10023333_38220 [Ferrimonas pelagia]|uniref:Uncharacterized protein n=1 Tax=Ferrimonas pelagia TaxID=1177826 RepID=A0ABP9FEN3_9GAMM
MLAASSSVAAIELGADTELSFNATLASNYLFRGVSLSDDDFAVQGGADLAHGSGLYAGIWASTYDNGGDTETEVDWWAGYGFDLSDSLSLDVGVTRYYYPSVGGHTTEWYAGAAIADATVTLFYDQHIEQWYFQGGYDFTLPADVVLSAHVGYTEPDEASGFYDLGLTASYAINDHIEVFGGAVYHEEEKDNYVAGVNFYF